MGSQITVKWESALVVTVFLVIVGGQIARASAPPTCNLSSHQMVSPSACIESDLQSSNSSMGVCLPFLTDSVGLPSEDCCTAVHNASIAYQACLCSVTFYPPAYVNATRQKVLPGLCNVTADLCVQCPVYLVQRTDDNTGSPSNYKNSVRALAVVLALLMVATVIGLATLFWKRHRANAASPPQTFPSSLTGSAY